MKGNPAVVETAGFLVVSRGLRVFGIKLIGSFAAFFGALWNGVFLRFYTRIYTRKADLGRSQIFFVKILHLLDAGI